MDAAVFVVVRPDNDLTCRFIQTVLVVPQDRSPRGAVTHTRLEPRSTALINRIESTHVRSSTIERVTVLQGSLLGSGPEVEIGPLDTGLERMPLSDGAWVDVGRTWIGGSDLLFARLVESVPWRLDRRRMYERIVEVPRLLAFYDEDDALPDQSLATMRERLRAHYGPGPGGDIESVGLCLYRDGRDSVAWHGDRFGRGSYADTVVAIVSLGAARRFLLRPRGGGPSRPHVLRSGDLLVMGGSCQRTWEHCVPKTASPVGARISIQFRTAGVR